MRKEYTFVAIKTGFKSSHKKEWRLLVDNISSPAVPMVVKMMSNSVAEVLKDPHMDKGYQDYKSLYCLGAMRAETGILNHLLNGRALLFNRMGGYTIYNRKDELNRRKQKNLIWPDAKKTRKEVITISRWPAGSHWYLSSAKILDHLPYDLKFVSAERAKDYVKRKFPNVEIRVKIGRSDSG